MPDEDQIAIIMEDGVHRWNAWRKENPGVSPDLEGIELPQTFLNEVNFRNANLKGAHLAGASLRHADFSGANLKGANLHRADGQHAVFLDANLRG